MVHVVCFLFEKIKHSWAQRGGAHDIGDMRQETWDRRPMRRELS